VVVLKVQVRPWSLSDADFVMDGSQPLDPRKTVFVGGVPRPLRAGIYSSICVHVELFLITHSLCISMTFSFSLFWFKCAKK